MKEPKIFCVYKSSFHSDAEAIECESTEVYQRLAGKMQKDGIHAMKVVSKYKEEAILIGRVVI